MLKDFINYRRRTALQVGVHSPGPLTAENSHNRSTPLRSDELYDAVPQVL